MFYKVSKTLHKFGDMVEAPPETQHIVVHTAQVVIVNDTRWHQQEEKTQAESGETTYRFFMLSLP